MKYLLAEKTAMSYHFLVWTDETKTLGDGTPDPAFVKEFDWGITPPEGQTEQQYTDMMKREIPLLVADELKRMTPPPAPTPLAGF